MKILIAPNAFKDSLSAVGAADIMATAVRALLPTAQILTLPLADGGDGLLEVMTAQQGGQLQRTSLSDLLGEPQPLEAEFLWFPARRLALIESASAIGLRLLQGRAPDPMRASSRGLGELILAALALGAEELLIGLGGSATNDGGLGLAEALGCRILDAKQRPLKGNGAGLTRCTRLDTEQLDPRLQQRHFRVLCDVDNPLLGAQGATAVYGPQKGVTQALQPALEAGMTRLANHLFGQALAMSHGAGAAGGLGAMLQALLGAELVAGSQAVFALLDVDRQLAGCDLVLTGEGRLDAQSLNGKAPAEVAARARAQGIPCIALVGELALNADQLRQAGFAAAFSLCPGPVTLATAKAQTAAYLESITQQVLATFLLNQIKRP
jgi:glycerate kinase